MKIKGIFYKPGINGLGVSGFHHLPYRNRFDEAARHHDWMYDLGGDHKDREAADVRFLYDCVRVCDKTFQVTTSIIYFYAVRLFGWMFFKYKKL